MKLIEQLCDQINEEICDAQHYAEWALVERDEHRQLADALNNLSVDETRHADVLHNEVVRIINEYRQTRGEPPADMMAVYNYLHKKAIEKADHAKLTQSQYKR